MVPAPFVKQITFTHPKVTQCLCQKLIDGAESVVQEQSARLARASLGLHLQYQKNIIHWLEMKGLVFESSTLSIEPSFCRYYASLIFFQTYSKFENSTVEILQLGIYFIKLVLTISDSLNALQSSPNFLQKPDVIFTGIEFNLQRRLERTLNPLLPYTNTNCPFIDLDALLWISFYFIVLSGQVCTSSVQFILRFFSFKKKIILRASIYECARVHAVPTETRARNQLPRTGITDCHEAPWCWEPTGFTPRGISTLNGRAIALVHELQVFTNAFSHPNEDILSCHLLILKHSP